LLSGDIVGTGEASCLMRRSSCRSVGETTTDVRRSLLQDRYRGRCGGAQRLCLPVGDRRQPTGGGKRRI